MPIRRKKEEGRGKREGTTRIWTRIPMDKSLSLSQEKEGEMLISGFEVGE
jgi:hypothetical protein